MSNFLICTRNIKGQGPTKEFGDEPGPAGFLVVPDDATDYHPDDRERSDKTWLARLLEGRELEEILVFIHGCNMDRDVTLERHKILKKGLQDRGWKGELVTFAWPSKKHTLLYWEDRFDALDVCHQLVTKCIKLLNDQMSNGCKIRVNVLAHSTGALIVRESFRISHVALNNEDAVWAVGQMVFAAGDVSSGSMEGTMSDDIYRHCGRITNYFSNHDTALAVAGAKRLGFGNRVGRVGLPLGSPDKAVDVNCSDCYQQHEAELKAAVIHAELSHAWYFWSPQFLDDLLYTLRGDLDRNVIPTRSEDSKGEFWLKP